MTGGNGPFSVFPFEGDWNRYRVVIFLGWHTFRAEDGRKMLDFVKRGGYLLLAAPHLSTETHRNAPVTLPESPELDELLGLNWQNAEKVIHKFHEGGRVVYFPCGKYPDAFAEEYASAMKTLTMAAVAKGEEIQKGWIKSGEGVSFSVWDHDGIRVIYLLNIRWWDRKNSRIKLWLADDEYELGVPFGQLYVLTIAEMCAVLPEHPLADVMDPDGNGHLKIQSPEPGVLHIYRKGKHYQQAFPAGISVLNA